MVISRYNRITKDMSFEDWLLQNYGTTPEQLLHVALVTTGRHSDYDKALAWYKDRYRKQYNNLIHDMGTQITLADYFKTLEVKS